MNYWVYVHTCPNEKRYVGITTRIKPEIRWGKNGENYQYNKHFYSAILKYGWNNFQHEAWELTCESEMYYAEKYLIAYYNTTDNRFGYNHSTGGEKSSLGCKYSEESRKKMSQSMKGKHHKPFSAETKKKMSESRKKSHSDPEVRRKISEAHKGKPLSKEHRKRMAEAQKKRCSDPEIRRKMSEAAKKKAKNPEYLKKLSEAHKGKSQPRIKISLPDGTIVEVTKHTLTRWYVNRGKEFEYVS